MDESGLTCHHRRPRSVSCTEQRNNTVCSRCSRSGGTNPPEIKFVTERISTTGSCYLGGYNIVVEVKAEREYGAG